MANDNLDFERGKLTLELVKQLVTQVLTLATSLIAASVALAKLTTSGQASDWHVVTFVSLLNASVLFGLLALGACVSHLANGKIDVARSRTVTSLAALQMIIFLAALVVASHYATKLIAG